MVLSESAFQKQLIHLQIQVMKRCFYFLAATGNLLTRSIPRLFGLARSHPEKQFLADVMVFRVSSADNFSIDFTLHSCIKRTIQKVRKRNLLEI